MWRVDLALRCVVEPCAVYNTLSEFTYPALGAGAFCLYARTRLSASNRPDLRRSACAARASRLSSDSSDEEFSDEDMTWPAESKSMADRVGMKRSFDVELSERCNALRCQRGMTLDLTSVGFRIFSRSARSAFLSLKAFMADMVFLWCSVVVFVVELTTCFCRINDLRWGETGEGGARRVCGGRAVCVDRRGGV